VFLFEIKLAIQTMKSAKKWRRQNATNGSDGHDKKVRQRRIERTADFTPEAFATLS
jgi:hypothetical protein